MDKVTGSELLAKPEVQDLIAELRRSLRCALPETGFAAREEAVLVILNEAMRSFLEEELAAIARGFGDRLTVNGAEYKRHEPGSGKYHCLGGPISVERDTYRPVGVHNGKTIVPLELVAGLAEGATPAFAYNVIHGYAQRDMRQHGESLSACHRVAPPRATLERMAKRLAAKAHEAVPRLEPVLRQAEVVPEGAKAICMGLDRTAVAMAEARDPNAPAKPATKRRKPRQRRTPEPIDVAWRMAYVGTVTIVDRAGEAIVTRRYAAPACDNPHELVRRMTADIRAAVRRQPSLKVGVVQDAAPEMWNVVRDELSLLQDKHMIRGWEEGIDRCHLLGHLAEALELTEPDAAKRKSQLHEWNEMLDESDFSIDIIERELASLCVELPREKEEAMVKQLIYIENNKDRMRYVSLAKASLPIGSGVTESAAKTVVGRRAKNSGQRWSEPGLRGALTLRAVHQSGRLPRFWNYLSRRYTADVAEAA